MARKKVRSQKSSKEATAIRWSDPEIIWFAGEERLPEGAIEQHSLSDIAGYIFGRKKEDVEADWTKIVGQISSLISMDVPLIKEFALDEVTFQLGFSAEGHLVFVAKAGVQTTISAKFKRKP
jgi:hypothetical protein